MKLSNKLSIVIFIVVTVTLVLFQMSTTAFHISQLTNKVEKAADISSKRLGITLADSLWNYNIANAKNIASAELGTNDLVSIAVYNLEGKRLFKVTWDEQKQQIVESDFTGNVFIKLDQNIQYNDQSDLINTGKIELVFSSATLDHALNESIIEGIIEIVFLALILIIFVHWFIRRLIMKPLSSVSQRIKAIANGDGDLTQRVDYHSDDELGEFADHINLFISSIHVVVSEIVGVSKSLDASAVLSSSNVDKLNLQAVDLSQQVAKILLAIEALDQTVINVAQQASISSKITQDTSSLASEGMQKVNGATQLIHSLAENMQESTEKTALLEQHSQSIDTVIQVIQSIAEQTNLLALNAAIEAARAGDQGRGFAVVADEVRTLAQRTQDSTGQITEMIENLQKQSAYVLTKMQDGQKLVADNVESVTQTEHTFRQIKTSIESNLSGAKTIAKDTDNQKSTLCEIKNNLENIQATNDQTLEVAKKSAKVNHQLVEMSQTVTQLSDKFKV